MHAELGIATAVLVGTVAVGVAIRWGTGSLRVLFLGVVGSFAAAFVCEGIVALSDPQDGLPGWDSYSSFFGHPVAQWQQELSLLAAAAWFVTFVSACALRPSNEAKALPPTPRA